MIKQQIVNEIHKIARRNFERRSVFLMGINDLWQADLIDIKNIGSVNKGFNYILVVIDCFTKYVWTFPLKTKTKKEIVDSFERLFKIGRKPKNLQTDLGKEFYNDEFKKIMKKYNINHYSSYSTKKASIVERVIRTLKNKLYKYFSFVGNYKWIGKPLNEIVVAYNNSVHRITKYKPADVNAQNASYVLNNINKSQLKCVARKPRFKVGDFVRISKYKCTFKKGYTPNWSTEIFTVSKVNNSCPHTYNLEDNKKQLILGTFYEYELQKAKYPKIYLIEKVIKRKGNKIYVKWLGLDEKENSWIDKSNIV